MAQARKHNVTTRLVFKPTAPANVPALEEVETQETADRDTMKCGGSGCGALNGVDVKQADSVGGAARFTRSGWAPGQ